jgi:Mannosyltransferase (PIG-V)
VAAGQRVRERLARRVEVPEPTIRRSPVLGLYAWSRIAVWGTALFAVLTLAGEKSPQAARLDDPRLTHDLGAVTDVWVRWDSVWFLRIAEHGYAHASPTGAANAFFPLYPETVHWAGKAFLGHYVLAGILVSLAASLVAFFLLHRVGEERLGVDGARRAVLYLALFPTTFFLLAVYSEALFLALSLGAFVLAERRRWLPAWALVGLAILTRPAGIALVPPLLLLAWRSPARKRAVRSFPIAVALACLYPLWLWREFDDPFAFARAQALWHRHLSPAGPLGGIWDGLRASWAGVQQLASGSHVHRYWPAVTDTDPMRVALINLASLAFLVFFCWLTVIAWRRFGAPYGLFCALSLAVPLSTPSSQWPLQSLPRLGLTVFPLFLALAVVGGKPRVHTAIVGVSAMLLGVFVTEWALWQWVA